MWSKYKRYEIMTTTRSSGIFKTIYKIIVVDKVDKVLKFHMNKCLYFELRTSFYEVPPSSLH